jgi:hypothetical protein
MAIDGFSVIGSELAVYGFIEITIAMLNYAYACGSRFDQGSPSTWRVY